MRPADLLRMLARRPFRPFRIRALENLTFDVRHPEQVIVDVATADIDLALPGDVGADKERFVILSLRMIMTLEPLDE